MLPADTLDGLRKLSDPEIREAAGILKANVFMFPYTENSNSHIINKKANAKNAELTTASQMRHKLSTYYALLGLPQKKISSTKILITQKISIKTYINAQLL